MRVPLSWLHDYVHPDITAFELASKLALTGTEVERVEHHGVSAPENFVVGKVRETRKHPDADKLNVCLVDLGEAEPVQIVCGAPNVAAGQTVAVARPGAVMPDGTKLKRAKLRGQESNGMILADNEVGIGVERSGGIMVLGDELRAGDPLADHLPIATDVLVLEITPNRPDCLGIYGVAREIHAATGAPLKPPPWRDDPGSADHAVDGVSVTVECPELNPRFTARAFTGVSVGPSPAWLKARLTAAGQRPISNVVDITNYVMLVTGQPLHAFDLDAVAGAQLTVRRAGPGETVETLDGQTRTLTTEDVLIADADGPTSIAGLMGGARSEVSEATTRVLMEAATWDGAAIHRTSLRLGLRSEASGRFEKGLQPEQAMEAQALATRLMIELTGATVAPGTIDIGGSGPQPSTIRLRDARVEKLLGAAIPRRRAANLLEAIDFTTVDRDDGLDVTVPAFRRADVSREADLIEEVARLDGLENLPATLPSRGSAARLTPVQRLRRAAADALCAQGLSETVGWSFTDAGLPQRLGFTADHPAVRLENPLSSENSHLRTTLLASLLDNAARNRARGVATLRLFEQGAVYLPGEETGERPAEPQRIAALLTGERRSAGWRTGGQPASAADFFTVKGVLEGLLSRVRAEAAFAPHAAGQCLPFLHPSRQALVSVGGQELGWIGEIHPTVAARWDLEQTVASFEVDLDVLAAHVMDTPMFTDVTSFPEIREDLAVLVPTHVAAQRVLDVVLKAGRPLLASAEVFDRYEDPARLGPDVVSLALRLSYRAGDRTLTDDEVAARRSQIVSALGEQVEGRVREA